MESSYNSNPNEVELLNEIFKGSIVLRAESKNKAELKERFRHDMDSFYRRLPAKGDKLLEVPHLPAAATEIDLIESVYKKFDGMVLGEHHDQLASYIFLIDNMAMLKASGVTTIYLEGEISLPRTPDTHLPPEYATRGGGYLKSKYAESTLSDAGFPFRQGANAQSPYTRLKLFMAAEQEGIEVKGVEHRILTRHEDRGVLMSHLKKHKLTDRLKELNYFATKYIEHDRVSAEPYSPGKWLFLGGLAHMTVGYHRGSTVPGLAKILGVPGVYIENSEKGRHAGISEDSNHDFKGRLVAERGDYKIAVPVDERVKIATEASERTAARLDDASSPSGSAALSSAVPTTQSPIAGGSIRPIRISDIFDWDYSHERDGDITRGMQDFVKARHIDARHFSRFVDITLPDAPYTPLGRQIIERVTARPYFDVSVTVDSFLVQDATLSSGLLGGSVINSEHTIGDRTLGALERVNRDRRDSDTDEGGTTATLLSNALRGPSPDDGYITNESVFDSDSLQNSSGRRAPIANSGKPKQSLEDLLGRVDRSSKDQLEQADHLLTFVIALENASPEEQAVIFKGQLGGFAIDHSLNFIENNPYSRYFSDNSWEAPTAPMTSVMKALDNCVQHNTMSAHDALNLLVPKNPEKTRQRLGPLKRFLTDIFGLKTKYVAAPSPLSELLQVVLNSPVPGGATLLSVTKQLAISDWPSQLPEKEKEDFDNRLNVRKEVPPQKTLIKQPLSYANPKPMPITSRLNRHPSWSNNKAATQHKISAHFASTLPRLKEAKQELPRMLAQRNTMRAYIDAIASSNDSWAVRSIEMAKEEEYKKAERDYENERLIHNSIAASQRAYQYSRDRREVEEGERQNMISRINAEWEHKCKIQRQIQEEINLRKGREATCAINRAAELKKTPQKLQQAERWRQLPFSAVEQSRAETVQRSILGRPYSARALTSASPQQALSSSQAGAIVAVQNTGYYGVLNLQPFMHISNGEYILHGRTENNIETTATIPSDQRLEFSHRQQRAPHWMPIELPPLRNRPMLTPDHITIGENSYPRLRATMPPHEAALAAEKGFRVSTMQADGERTDIEFTSVHHSNALKSKPMTHYR